MVGSFGKKRKGAYNPNRVNALDSGVAYIAVLAVFALASFGLQYVPTEFFREIYEYDVYLYLIVNTLFSQFLIFAVALVCSLIRKVNPFSGGGFVAKKDAVHSLSAVILTAGIMMTFYYVHLQFGSDVTTFTGSTDFPFEENLSELAFVYAFLYVILSALLPAVFEEMLFRGIIMRGLEQYGKVFAVVVSSLMFALMHGNFEQLILQFIGGLAIGTVVMLTGNFVLGSLMHFFNNFFAMIFAAMINPLESTAFSIYRATVADAASIVIGIAFLIFGVLYFGSMLVENVVKEREGKPKKRFERPIVCVMKTENGEEKTFFADEKAEMLPRSAADGRLFLIRGKFIPLNKKSNPYISGAVLAVGIIFAVVGLFL